MSVVTTGRAASTGIPCAMVLMLIPRSPRWPGCFATVACGIASANLTPASGRQDHTASPSASAPLVLRRWYVHRIPHPTFVTMANAPLVGTGRCECEADLGCSATPSACDRLTRRAIYAWRPCAKCPSGKSVALFAVVPTKN